MAAGAALAAGTFATFLAPIRNRLPGGVHRLDFVVQSGNGQPAYWGPAVLDFQAPFGAHGPRQRLWFSAAGKWGAASVPSVRAGNRRAGVAKLLDENGAGDLAHWPATNSSTPAGDGEPPADASTATAPAGTLAGS